MSRTCPIEALLPHGSQRLSPHVTGLWLFITPVFAKNSWRGSRGADQSIVPTKSPERSIMNRPTTDPPGGTRTGRRIGGAGAGVGGVGSTTS